MHAHDKDRWLQTKKCKSWARSRVRRAQYVSEVLDGTLEFEDTAHFWGRPLDYVSHAYLHVWRAAEDRRHRGRRAIDRTRTFTRPGSFSQLFARLNGMFDE